jgi:hypothetical protein
MVHSAMAQSQLVLPSSIDDQYLTQLPEPPGLQPDGLPSFTECYIQTVQLQGILGRVLTSLYYEGPGSGQDDLRPINLGVDHIANSNPRSHSINNGGLQRILAVDSELLDWRNKLPLHLKSATYQDPATALPFKDSGRVEIFRRQANALELR